MPTDKNALKAGLFIVAAVLLGATLLVAIQGTRSWFEPMRSVTAAFDLTENLGGLKPGDPVRVGGFDQGRVQDVRFIAEALNEGRKPAPPHFEVVFTLPKKFDLRGDARVDVEQALTGAADLNISDFGHADPWKDGTPLDGRPSAIGTFYAIAPELQGLIADVRAKVGPAYDRYDTTLARAGDAVVETKTAMAAFTAFLGGSGTDMRATLANLNKTTETLQQRLPRTLDKADAFIDQTNLTVADARQTIADIHASMKDAKAAVTNARDLTAEARSLLERNHSRIDNIIASGRDTAANLEGATAEIRRNPWRLLYKPSADEVGNLTLYDTTRQFARAAAQLNDAAGAVRDAAKDPDIDKPTLDALVHALNDSFGKYQKVEQALWQAVK